MPPHNAHLFVCGPRSSASGGSADGSDLQFSRLADEALQAPEPVGWEQRQDPRGNTYYLNTTTNMTMMQHPVDYHYQQFYLQMKQQKMNLRLDFRTAPFTITWRTSTGVRY